MTPLQIIVSIVAILIVGAIALHFKGFKEWLLWGVAEAEEYLGSGTGELKLRYVYNLAIERFPIVAKLIPFFIFKKLVDLALDKMRELIEKNKKIAEILTASLPTEGDDAQ
jgi:hypothetical protein